jgi:hypothetical protein
MIERIALALNVDTTDLFNAGKKTADTIQKYRKATIKDIKSLLGQFLDERLSDLEKKPE